MRISDWSSDVCSSDLAHSDWRENTSAYTAASLERLIAGSALPAGDYLRARRVRSDLRRRGEAIFDDVDVLLCPATPTAAPRVAPPVDDMWAEIGRAHV